MGVPISNVTRRVVYAASGTGPYNFTFEILSNTDVAVYRDDALLTLTTDYTVTINTNGTGYITLTAAPTGATQIAIVGDRTIQRMTDFVTGGDFFANTVNDEMDQQTIFAQQNAEGLQRALSAPQTDPTSINMTLPRASLRANKTLGFDANGNPALGETLGTNRGNWASGTLYYVRDIVKDTTNNNIWQCLTQHTSSGSQPINTNTDSAKWTLLVDAASATSSASAAASSASAASSSASAASTSASNASTSASNASTSATNAASSASAASTSATNAASSATSAASSAASAASALDSFDDRYLGSKTSDPTLDNDGNALLVGALYYRSTAPIGMKVYDGTQWLAAASSDPLKLNADNPSYTGTLTGGTGVVNLGSNQFYKDASGRIGVGIVPSAWSYTAAQVSFLNFYSLSDYQGGIVRGAFFNGTNWIAQNSFMGMTRYYTDEDNHIWQLADGVTSGGTVTWKNAFKIATNGQQSSVIPGGTTLYNEYKCRAWVNFNGTGTVAIRASGNVSSITDNGLSDYTANFTTAMPDANFSVVATGNYQINSAGNSYTFLVLNGNTASSARVTTVAPSADQALVCLAVFR